MLKESSYYQKLRDTFYTPESMEIFNDEDKESNEILSALLSWVDKYPRINGKHTKKDIEIWIELVTCKKILEKKEAIVKNYLERKNVKLDFKQFFSWTMIAYVTFYKFYFKHRQPRLSDLNDILMSSSFPYVDAVIIEKDMAETIKQIQSKHHFATNLEIMTIDSFR